jgi:hypothetical protein
VISDKNGDFEITGLPGNSKWLVNTTASGYGHEMKSDIL